MGQLNFLLDDWQKGFMVGSLDNNLIPASYGLHILYVAEIKPWKPWAWWFKEEDSFSASHWK